MKIPRLLPGTVLLLLAGHLPALELSVIATEAGGHAVVQCHIEDPDTGEMIRSLDAGGTLRVTWRFRMGNTDTSIVRFAHRDSLGEGYIVYSDESPVPRGPFSAGELVGQLSVLPPTVLVGLGIWDTGEVLGCRLFIDYTMVIPPLSLGGMFSGYRDRTGWQDLPHPEERES